jgi:hypothetical protein
LTTGRPLEAVWAFLDRVGREVDAFEKALESPTLFELDVDLSESWLNRLFAEHRNVVQLSRPAPMVATTAEEALDRVFDQLVIDPAHRRYEFQKKNTALAAVRDAYRRHHVRKGVNLRERVIVRSTHHAARFDFAVTNGRALQLTQTWSFQVPDQDALAEQVKAWGWTLHDLRQSGGAVAAVGDAEFEVASDVEVEVVYVPPAEAQGAPALKDAESVFEALSVKSLTIDQAETVGRRARDLLVEAGAVTMPLTDT